MRKSKTTTTIVALTAVFVALGFWALRISLASIGDQQFGRLIVYSAVPERRIKHEVDWKGVISPTRRESMLVGPLFYSTPLGEPSSNLEEPLFSWYKLSPPARSRTARVSVWPNGPTSTSVEFQLDGAAYLLATTQLLGAGKPADVPEGLGQYVAYRVVGHSDENRKLQLTTKTGPQEVTLNTPVFLCLPVEEWHHDAYFPLTDSTSCWIVYQISPVEHADTISTLDQFGLNTLTLDSAEWLCVPAPKFEVASRGS